MTRHRMVLLAAALAACAAEPPPPLDSLEPVEPIDTARTRMIHDLAADATVPSAIVPRDELTNGDTVAGPAVIIEPQTTTVLGTTHTAVVQADRTLRITRAAGTPGGTDVES